MVDLETTKQFAQLVAPLTSAVIDTWVKPKLAQIAKKLSLQGDLDSLAFTSRFQEYLNRAYEKHAFLSVLVLQHQRRKLEDLYVPLTVTSKRRSYVIDDYKHEFLGKYNRVLLRDTAGMGKSTILKFLFLRAVQCNEGIPVFIELRKLGNGKSIVDIIHTDLNPIDDEISREFVLRLIRRGDFIFFLDGFDEIPFSYREEVAKELHDFISRAGANTIVITSRPETSLAAFGDFHGFNIQPLDIEEAFSLLRKYDDEGPLSEEIIQKLQDPALETIWEFLSNPLLVSLLYRAYQYKRTIPLKKHLFYRQVFDALFQDHDLSKSGAFVRDKWSRLNIDEFESVLRVLGFITMKLGKIEYEKDELLKLLCRAREQCPGLKFAEADFLRDLLTTVPLFLQEGDYFRWSHKSLQEYFAARFICQDAKGNQDAILLAMYHSKEMLKYFNVLDLVYDMDYKSFRRTILYAVLSDHFEHFDFSVRRWSNKVGLSSEVVRVRASLMFARVSVVSLLGGRRDKSQQIIGQDELKEYLHREGVLSDDYDVWNLWTNKKPPYVYADFVKPVYSLMRLLWEKQDSLLVSPFDLPGGPVGYRIPAQEREDRSTEARTDPLNSLIADFRKLRNPVVELDSELEVLCNPDSFELVNAALARTTLFCIDPEMGRRVFDEITREIALEASGDFLLHGL